MAVVHAQSAWCRISQSTPFEHPRSNQCRDVAQPGRALAWGARGRQFKSARPDQTSDYFRIARRWPGSATSGSKRLDDNKLIDTTKGLVYKGRVYVKVA